MTHQNYEAEEKHLDGLALGAILGGRREEAQVLVKKVERVRKKALSPPVRRRTREVRERDQEYAKYYSPHRA